MQTQERTFSYPSIDNRRRSSSICSSSNQPRLRLHYGVIASQDTSRAKFLCRLPRTIVIVIVVVVALQLEEGSRPRPHLRDGRYHIRRRLLPLKRAMPLPLLPPLGLLLLLLPLRLRLRLRRLHLGSLDRIRIPLEGIRQTNPPRLCRAPTPHR